jgi:hypothetical protein
MEKDFVLILEDDEKIYNSFHVLFKAMGINLEIWHCLNYTEYNDFMRDGDCKSKLKCIIMDLSNSPEETASSQFGASKLIMHQYEKNRIPIFIHSANLENYEELNNKGTIIKKKKGVGVIEEIAKTIQLMHESGFLNIFSFGGSLDKKIMLETHKAFVSQFKPNEIENIIKSIKSANTENFEERTVEVFERIALRAVYQNAISNVESIENMKVNSIEHYYRRTDEKDFYTGDIFVNKDKELVFVATPRCNLSNNNYEQLLLCKVNPLNESQVNSFLNNKEKDKDGKTGEYKGIKQFRTSITDDVTNNFIGERHRFLPKTPQFEGGFVDCSKCFSINPKEFIEKYDYVISLVDDLANDVIRKLAGYLLRGGISDTAYQEAIYYFKELEKSQEITPNA